MADSLLGSVVEGVLNFLKGIIFRPNLYCLWLWDKDHWKNLNPAGNSYGDCQQALKTILGQNHGHSVQWVILPKNFSPPERNVWDGGQ